jgi:hypothetical protein
MPHKLDGSDRYGHYAEDMSDVLEGKSSKIEKNIWRFALPDDPILQGDPYRQHLTNRLVPAQSLITADGGIGTDIGREFLEFHFYSKDTHQLQLSINVPLDKGYLWIRDSTRLRRNLGAYPTMQLGLELWRSHDDPDPSTPDVNERDAYTDFYQRYLTDENGESKLAPGYYNVIINFFCDELGRIPHGLFGTRPGVFYTGAANQYWTIESVSSNMKELILKPPAVGGDTFETQQFADNSMAIAHVQDMAEVNRNNNRKEHITNDDGTWDCVAAPLVQALFQRILTDSPKTMNYINSTDDHRLVIDNLFHTIIEEVLLEMSNSSGIGPDGYVESELNATRPRFRITESNFKAQLLAKLHEVIAKYIDHFPEDGRLFANV